MHTGTSSEIADIDVGAHRRVPIDAFLTKNSIHGQNAHRVNQCAVYRFRPQHRPRLRQEPGSPRGQPLTPAQQQVLAPLQPNGNSSTPSAVRVGVDRRPLPDHETCGAETPAEAHAGMGGAHARERRAAREKYQTLRKLPPEQRKELRQRGRNTSSRAHLPPPAPAAASYRPARAAWQGAPAAPRPQPSRFSPPLGGDSFPIYEAMLTTAPCGAQPALRCRGKHVRRGARSRLFRSTSLRLRGSTSRAMGARARRSR